MTTMAQVMWQGRSTWRSSKCMSRLHASVRWAIVVPFLSALGYCNFIIYGTIGEGIVISLCESHSSYVFFCPKNRIAKEFLKTLINEQHSTE